MRAYAISRARNGVKALNADNILGDLWLLLEPALLIGIYFLVFGVIADVRRNLDNFLAFLTVGQVVFTHSRRGIVQAASSLSRGAPLLQSFAFPRAVLPMAETLNALFTFLTSLVVMLAVVLILGESVRVGWLWVAPLAVGQLLMNFGIGLLLARMVTRFADVRTALDYLFRLTLYASGVLFPIQQFLLDSDRADLWLRLVVINPFYDLIYLYRWAILGIEPEYSGLMLVACMLWIVLSLVVGMVWFVAGERRYSGAKTIVKL